MKGRAGAFERPIPLVRPRGSHFFRYVGTVWEFLLCFFPPPAMPQCREVRSEVPKKEYSFYGLSSLSFLLLLLKRHGDLCVIGSWRTHSLTHSLPLKDLWISTICHLRRAWLLALGDTRARSSKKDTAMLIGQNTSNAGNSRSVARDAAASCTTAMSLLKKGEMVVAALNADITKFHTNLVQPYPRIGRV